MTGVTLLSVFLVGLFGGVHCASMCGGLVSVMAGSAGRRGAVIAVRAEGLRRPAGLLIGHNLGRLTSYTLAGALAGSLSSSATLVSRVLPLQQLAFVATNLLLIAIGLHLTGALRLVALEPVGAALWRRLQPLASRLLLARTPWQAWQAGLVWGWVPCGMVYGVLIAALVSGSPLQGALLMLAFGAGTLPNLLLIGAGAAAGQRWLARPTPRRIAGLLVAGFGLAGLARLDPGAHLHRVVDACLSVF